ncbi:hypothetical protein [Geodermatophilus sabuli]|uniref:DUF998 domain-containing protein n=1 Tax=Geodermatophilus sabuli TaxID=1564158 RepID=A0A285EI65_9ACTN|nr:hypothetical protein [Geodermatophilus sabuli]MBB3086917.1 hypothetical protein [Geodermatophilus sabuli]SNX98710.1 hypothetical protein SAMN06893097_1125 [Geodermatophilus sabuli]
MIRWGCALVVAGVLSAFAFLLVTGEYITDGPVLIQFSESHGVHRGDVFVLCGWVAAILSEVALLGTSRRR